MFKFGLPSSARSPFAAEPFLHLTRDSWSQLPGCKEASPEVEQNLTREEVERLQGLNSPMSLAEVQKIYIPLSRLLSLYVAANTVLGQSVNDFLRPQPGGAAPKIPFVIGVAGSVAAGKSTVSRLLQLLLRRWPGSPRVDLVATDGYLLSNQELRRRGLMERKGFPESYDRSALLRFLAAVKSGAKEVLARSYSHLLYDVVEEEIPIRRPDILVVEGLNLLQPPLPGQVAVSDLIDFGIYLDAKPELLEIWYVERFLQLQQGAFADPQSFFHRFARLSEAEATVKAHGIWRQINLPNLRENIEPTKVRASLILTKGEDHAISDVWLRKI